ncbi:MAG: hypothetical protein ACI9TZ_002092, partial [Yoonia sp.]
MTNAGNRSVVSGRFFAKSKSRYSSRVLASGDLKRAYPVYVWTQLIRCAMQAGLYW